MSHIQKEIVETLQKLEVQLICGLDETVISDRLPVLIKQYSSTCKDGKDFSHSAVLEPLLLLLVKAGAQQPKLARRLALVLSEIEKMDPELMRSQIKVHLEYEGTSVERGQFLGAWSQLLDCSLVSRSLMSEDIATFLGVINKQLTSLNSPVLTAEMQDLLQLCVKLTLQLSQHLSTIVRKIVWCSSSINDQSDASTQVNDQSDASIQINDQSDTQTQMGPILSCMLSILGNSIVYMDTRRLAATVIGYIVTLGENDEVTMNTIVNVLSCYGSQNSTRIGEINVKIHVDQSDDNSGELFLIHGFISCCTHAVFLSRIKKKENELDGPLYKYLFNMLYRHCSGNLDSYNAFKTLLLGWQKLQKIKPGELDIAALRYVVETTLSLMWTNLDSPVDGVTESVIEIFKVLINIVVSMEGNNSFDDLISHVTGHVMQMSWQVKGKHLLCAILLPHTDIKQFLEKYNDTWDQLLACMSLNYMAPPATEMYKAIISATLGEDRWKTVCLEWLVRGITHTDSPTCYNVCNYWLPWTLKTVTNSYQHILDELKKLVTSATSHHDDAGSVLRATISVCMIGRKLNIIDVTDVPESTLTQCLMHPSDDIRLEAFSLVCNSAKKSGCVSKYEIDLLKLSLPHAMTSDTPPFRQQLQSHIRALVVRIRDTSLLCLREIEGKEKLAALKEAAGESINDDQKSSHHTNGKKKRRDNIVTDPELTLNQQLDVLSWLLDLCTQYLHPGSSFQRLKTCLEWMWVILDSLVYQADKKKRRKGGCPESASRLLPYAVSCGKLSLFTYETTHSLLTCLQDGTDDVRELSCSILLEFFPHPLQLESPEANAESAATATKPVCELVEFAIKQCLQPRAHDANAGALLCKLIFHRYVIDLDWLFMQSDDDTHHVTVQLPGNTGYHGDPSMAYIQLLVGKLDESLQKAHADLLQAAQHNPTHGVLVAMQHCLGALCIKDVELWLPVINKLQVLTADLVKVALGVLGGKQQQQECGSLPSFEDMGLSIQSVIEESLGETDSQHDNTILSSHHQLLMTWAWLNIKETCILYSKLAALPATSGKSHLLTTDQIQHMGEVMTTILTRCRHRGAIEGSGVGLQEYCRCLLMSDDLELRDTPRQLLDKVIDLILESSATSVTRRSAGLPLIVKSVLASEAKTKQTTLLSYTVNKLLEIGSAALPQSEDRRVDLPHVHALNILKVLFAEACLAGSMLMFAERTCMLAIEGFSSPVWAVRNSSTQLFSSLLSRMMGQKKTKDGLLHHTTLLELFTHFPALKPFLLKHLQQATTENNRASLHPSLFPILTILSKLSVGVADLDGELSGYLEAVQSLASSPIYAVRELAAQALVPLVSPMDQYILELALDLPVSRDVCYSYNKTHGCLLQIHCLLDTLQHKKDEGNVEQHLLQVLAERAWLGSQGNECLVVKACYLRLMEKLCWSSSVIDEIAGYIVKQGGCVTHVVGGWELTKVVLQQWLMNSPDTLCSKVEACLASESADVWLACLQMLKAEITSRNIGNNISKQLKKMLYNFLRADAPWEILCDCLECIIGLQNVSLNDQQVADSIEKPNTSAWESVLMKVILDRGDSRPSALALTALSWLLGHHSKVTPIIQDWVKIVHSGCEPENSEILRYHCARSLHLVGSHILDLLLDVDYRTSNNELLAFRILQTAVTLLMDEQSDVRTTTAAFVGYLPWLPEDCLQGDIHPSYAIAALFDHVMCELCESPLCMKELMSWMSSQQPLDMVLSNQISGSEEIFEAQDVNPYAESHVLFANINHLIQTHKEELSTSICGTDAPEVLQQLDVCSKYLHKHCQGLMNVTGKRAVFEATMCLLYRVQAHLHVYQAQQSGTSQAFTNPKLNRQHVEDIFKHLEDIKNVKGLPPRLATLITDTVSVSS